MDEKNLKKIVVIYHAQCRDGFGGAFSAWKKLGDSASYIPQRTQSVPPPGLTDKEIYIIDYSYDRKTLEKLREVNDSVVVIDHHKSSGADVQAFSENIFDLTHSGAVLAWKYFHPNTPVPTLLRYIEDHDLWKFELDDTRAVGAALGEYETNFGTWDTLVEEFEQEEFRTKLIAHGTIISTFEDKLVDSMLVFAERVTFEDKEMYALNASRIYRSILGNKLAEKNKLEGGVPCGIVYYRYGGNVHISLRSSGDFDVSAIAQQYGGGGHKNAASIKVPDFKSLPFTFIKTQ